MLGDMLHPPVVRLLAEGSLRPPPGPVPGAADPDAPAGAGRPQ
ncbi:MAG: hypothetical protein U0835_19980 [Isosphaeraceae bacterium]